MQKLQQQIDFLLEIDQLKAVYRKAMIKSDNNRFENSAEHSWHIALAGHVLREYAPAEVDMLRVQLMLLLHDLVEIDAGDLFAFHDDPKHHELQAEKEKQAVERIFGLLPQEQYERYAKLWHEFELSETIDAKYAKSIDRILPLLQNIHNEGGSWVGHNLSSQRVLERNKYLQEIAPELWRYVQEQIAKAVEKGWLLL